MSSHRPRSGSDLPTSTIRLGEAEDVQAKIAQSVREALMPVLIVISGPNVGQRVRLEGLTVVGRDPLAGLSLTDPIVSFRHACFEDRGDGWAVIDTASTNGTFIDGERITERMLRGGDRISIGSSVLRFEEHDPIEQAYDDVMDRMLNIDELSGLWVRRRFDQELAKRLESVRQDQRPLALLVMDLDGVKRINDSHGHAFGAHVIGAAGHLIRDMLDARRGIGSRFGGDEYIAALTSVNALEAQAFAEEVLAKISGHTFMYEGVALRVGISIGLAMFPADGVTAEALFQVADAAMYRAKQAGKGRVSR